MIKLVILSLVLTCIQLAHSNPVNEATSELAEFDRLFNERHLEIDYTLRTYRMNFSLSVKNLNAQFISRFGFVITDIQHMRQQTKDAILEHALDVIGDPQNPCIVAVNDEAIRWATQAARDLSVVSERAYGSLSIFSLILVRPNIDMVQMISTSFQGLVMNLLGHSNPVADLQGIQAELATLYLETSTFVDFVIISLDNQLDFFQSIMNDLRRDVFQTVDAIALNFIYNMEQLIEKAQQCS